MLTQQIIARSVTITSPSVLARDRLAIDITQGQSGWHILNNKSGKQLFVRVPFPLQL